MARHDFDTTFSELSVDLKGKVTVIMKPGYPQTPESQEWLRKINEYVNSDECQVKIRDLLNEKMTSTLLYDGYLGGDQNVEQKIYDIEHLVIWPWQRFWMNKKDSNYRDRAFSIDANMKWHLASKIYDLLEASKVKNEN